MLCCAAEAAGPSSSPKKSASGKSNKKSLWMKKMGFNTSSGDSASSDKIAKPVSTKVTSGPSSSASPAAKNASVLGRFASAFGFADEEESVSGKLAPRPTRLTVADGSGAPKESWEKDSEFHPVLPVGNAEFLAECQKTEAWLHQIVSYLQMLSESFDEFFEAVRRPLSTKE